MWRPGERRAVGPMTASLSFARPVVPTSGKGRGYFAPGRGTFHGWKVPKDPRVCGPGPKRTFGKRSKFVRRGHELGAAASSARCRSHLSNSRFPSFPPRASRVPCLSGFVRFVLPIPQGPMIPTPSGLRPSPPDRGSRPHRADPARAEPLPYGKAPQERRAACGLPGNMDSAPAWCIH